MKRNRIVTFFFVLGLMVCFLNPTTGAAVDDYIDIDNPQLRKIPLALPLFVPISNDPDELNMSRVVSDLFWETLNSTGYFTMLHRNYSHKASPDNQTSVFKKIAISGADFEKWIDSGAELLITGGILMKGDTLEIELRTYDLYKRTLLAGKKYKGQKEDYRKMVLRFCGDLIYRLTGTEWLFKTQIAFISGRKGKKDVYVCEFDGGNPERFTFTNSITLSPAWSSDAEWIAYTSYLRGKPDIFIRHFRENRGTVISKKGVNLFPDWLPGKYAFAATLSYSGDPEIYLLTGEGKIAKRLTYSKGIDVSVSWAPDGKQFAFVSDRSGTPQIYIKDSRLNRVRRLTFQGKYNSSPNWSPRGDKVAFTGLKDGNFNIFVMGVNDKEVVQLTDKKGNNESPSWSPNASHIAFSSSRGGDYRIYTMTAFGKNQRRLLVLPGEQTDPAWSPTRKKIKNKHIKGGKNAKKMFN